ncbi:hypothetical protein D3C73_590790 [compost metagenome]
MLDHDAFRASRRTRGVNHISQVLRGASGRFKFHGQGIPVINLFIVHGIDSLKHQPVIGQPTSGPLQQMTLRKQHRCFAIAEHVLNPLRRIIGVQRYVGSAGFPNGEHPDQQLHRTLRPDPRNRLPSHALSAKERSQPLGAFVQFTVGELFVHVDDCRMIRNFPGKLFNIPMKRFSLAQPCHRRVKKIENAVSLLIA